MSRVWRPGFGWQQSTCTQTCSLPRPLLCGQGRETTATQDSENSGVKMKAGRSIVEDRMGLTLDLVPVHILSYWLGYWQTKTLKHIGRKTYLIFTGSVSPQAPLLIPVSITGYTFSPLSEPVSGTGCFESWFSSVSLLLLLSCSFPLHCCGSSRRCGPFQGAPSLPWSTSSFSDCSAPAITSHFLELAVSSRGQPWPLLTRATPAGPCCQCPGICTHYRD